MQRQEYIDFACGIAIIEIVVNHFIRMFHNEDILFFWQTTSQILSFSTAFFFFKSGLFFSFRLDERNNFRRICNRYLFPFTFFSIIAEPIYWIDLYSSGVPITELHSYSASLRTIFHLGNMAGNAPCWFLLSLFFILSIFNTIRDKWDIRVLLGCTSTLFLVYHYFDPFPIHLCSLSHTLTGFFFFLCGRLLKNHIHSRSLLLSSIIALIIIVLSDVFVHVDIFYDKVRIGKYWIWPIQTIALIVVFCNFCKFIFFSTSFLCHKLAYIGKNTMSLFVTHWPFMLILRIIGKNFCQFDSFLLTITVLVSYFLLIPYIIRIFENERLRFLIGK